MLEILYLSVAVVTAYQSQLLLRRAGPGQRAYAMLLAADGIVAALAFLGSRFGEVDEGVKVAGAAALFGFVGLVVVPPILRDLTRRALAREQLGLAVFFARVRELLSPGMGARQERDLIEIVRSVRSGEVETALAGLRARRDASEDLRERAALDDRIVFTLLSAARWQDATVAYERARVAGGPASVPLAVEMVRAYGERGDLERAVEIVAFLESVPVGEEPALSAFAARARLFFLAFAGRPDAVAATLAAGGPLATMPVAARAYWLGSAYHFAGDAAAAKEALTRAVALSRRDVRGRTIAQERLAAPVPPARELSPAVAAFADRPLALVASPAAHTVAGVTSGPTPATWALVGLNVAVHLLVSFVLGSTEHGWVLARAGANLRSAAFAGEPWRLLTSTFLHVGALHLALNMLALWSVGRLVERMLGSVRFTVVYLVAGVAGSTASVLFGGAGLSAGASGAVLGIVGAAIVELALLRRGGRGSTWHSVILGNMLFVVVAQLAIGLLYPIIDQSAHVGGLVAGALLTWPLSPASAVGRARATRIAAWALFSAAVVAIALSVVAVLRTPYAETVGHTGWERHTLGGVSLELPRLWTVKDGTASDPAWMLAPTLTVDRLPSADLPGVTRVVADALKEQENVGDVSEVSPSFAAPAGFSVHELRFVYSAGPQRWPYRQVLFTRPHGDGALTISLVVPEAQMGDAGAIAGRILSSVQAP